MTNFPKIPIYPGAESLHTEEYDQTGDFLYESAWVTTDDITQVSQWFIDALNDGTFGR